MKQMAATTAGAALILALAVSLSATPVGDVVAWGSPGTYDFGQTTVPAGLADAIAISGGWGHSLALRLDGSIVAWGDDSYGMVTNAPSGVGYQAIAAGELHSLAIAADGSLVSWGSETSVPAGTGYQAIAGGAYHSLGIDASGAIVQWGDVFPGAPTGTDLEAVAAGAYHSLALRADGTVEAWDAGGALTVPAAVTDVKAIAAGDFHNLALKEDGTVVAWDTGGNLLTVPTGLSGVTTIAAGGDASMAVSGGQIVAWGSDTYAQVTGAPAGSDFIAIAAGNYHGLAIEIPEPATMSLVIAGLAAMSLRRRRS